jgi:cell wall-associated NlpC family hydrolase
MSATRVQLEITREAVLAEAMSWIRTPYHPGGQVKGAGCDCGTFIFCVYRACGLVPDEEVGIFSQDWFRNTSEEKYLFRLMRHAHKVAEAVSYPTLNALPGNIVLTKAVNSRVYNHGGIVIKWPRVIHAVAPCVEECDASTHRLWEHQIVTVLDPWVKP